MSEQRVENRQQLAHAGGQGDFLRLARRAQSCREGADHRVVARGDQGGHVQRTPNPRHVGSSAMD